MTALDHLRPELWAEANRILACKAISEFSHERILQPRALAGNTFLLGTDTERISYRFRAVSKALNHLRVEAGTLCRIDEGEEAPPDAIQLILDLKQTLAISEAMLPGYLEELASTLYSLCYKLANGRSARELVDGDFQELEAAMIEGHPNFVANNARIGFDAEDFQAFAPETAARVRLVWLAAHKSRARFSCSNTLEEETFMTAELGAEQLARFRQMLQKRRLDPNDYVFMPVHPWQWRHKLVGAFAPDIARGDLVYLGHGEDDYQPQQSIRTFFNIDRPERCYVKTSISVLNMGFIRGLSPGYMQATPAINDWLFELVEADPYFQEKGFSVIREVASVGYHTRYYHEATEKNTAHKKMLSALWRESVVPRLKPNQRLMSMAALLHRDPQGDAFLKPLIQASGQSVSDWLERYLDCYMSPLLHCFFAHDLVFLPHGENVILILEDNLCISAVMKDTAEEIGVFDKAERLPEPAKRVAVPVPEEVRILSLLTDLLDCFFRFLVDVLEEEELCTAEDFWRLAAQTVHRYEARFPEGREKYLKHDMFVKSFQLSCLNRLQLRDRYQLIDLADPAGSLMFAGMLDNPLAPFGRDRR